MNRTRIDPEDGSMAEVFICHHRSPDEDALARRLAERLREAGISVFTDLESISGGENFRRKINDTIPEIRLVIALFAEGYSDWQVAEAGCAFLDAKLLPVCIEGIDPPAPFATLNALPLPHADKEGHEAAFDAVVQSAIRLLRGENRGWLFHAARHLNHAFARGLAYVYLALLPLVFLAIGGVGERPAHVEIIKYLHVIAGMLTLGGGILLSVGFARAFASRSYRTRRAGFRTANGLFILWLVVAVATLVLGVLTGFATGRLGQAWVTWSIIAYLVALIFWGLGYFCVYMAHEADEAHKVESFVQARAVAGLCFLVAFVLTVAVVDMMLLFADAPPAA